MDRPTGLAVRYVNLADITLSARNSCAALENDLESVIVLSTQGAA